MSWQERKTRREFFSWLGGLAAASAFGIPLVLKFAKDAQALSGSSQPPDIKAISKDIPPTPELVETPALVDSQQLAELQQPQTELKAEVKEVKTGIELLEALGLRGKITYIVYGRPKKHGEQTWGTLGGSQTAEESWQVFKATKEQVKEIINKNDEDFALNIINPVYNSKNGPIKPIYIEKALKLAPENQGLVALNFNSIEEAKTTIQALESEHKFPKELLKNLAVSLDIEHFKGGKATASDLNEFTAWFAQKHKEWAGDSLVPGLVIIYTWHGPITGGGDGKIENIGDLVQYYLPEKTLVVTLFDGWGSKQAKLNKMGEIVDSLKPNNEENPALVGVMEAKLLHGERFDSASVQESFETLQGAPVFFFATQ